MRHKTLNALAVLMFSMVINSAAQPLSMDLRGTWRFELDPRGVGENQQWFGRDLTDHIPLPGTTDQASKGYALNHERMSYAVEVLRTQWPGTALPQRADEAGTLVREWLYIGKAWYQRDLDIPASWQGKPVQLQLERTIWRTKVWLDDRFVGTCDSLVTGHHYDLGALTPGRHRLTIRVDNDLQHNIGIIGHSYGPETQSRWNGLVGDLRLVATAPVFIRGVQVFPDALARKVRARVTMENTTGRKFDGSLILSVNAAAGATPIQVLPVNENISGSQLNLVVEGNIAMGETAQLWSEFSPALYSLRAEVRGEAGDAPVQDEQTVTFGLREIRRDGRHILVNGQRILLRGTLDCCVNPKTGHPPMTVAEWERVLGIIKDYGFNHVRFHSWCPPEAAFAAADRLGLYLEPETPFWVDDWTTGTSSHPKLFGFDADVVEYVRNEVRRISAAYGNHPSFALFCLGNEFGMGSDWEAVNRVLAEANTNDSRRLYSATTARKRSLADDFWLTHSTGKNSTRGVGPAHTDWDFAAAAAEADLPVLAHETGQRPVFPDFADLLPKFTGPLKPYNYARLERLLAASGLAGQTKDFARTSAKYQLVQYKAEHEAMRRTADYAGYQLLMLNDFTGQSEALVGILDPFWESKGVVSVADVRQWNAPTVPLARFKRYVWTSGETLEATLEVSHFGAETLRNAPVHWSLLETDGRVLVQGDLDPRDIPNGALTRLGQIRAPIERVTKPVALLLRLSVGETTNQWRHWAYPASGAEPIPDGVLVTHAFDAAAHDTLARGGRVLVLPAGLKNARVAKARFESVYWSAGWWGNAFSSLGILCDPKHPALAGFPNDGFSDWQWQPVVQAGALFDLTGVPPGYRPIIQAVPDFHYDRLLGLLFETRVGPGRLLVCGLNVETANPAASALKSSLLRYAGSDDFAPRTELGSDLLDRLLSQSTE